MKYPCIVCGCEIEVPDPVPGEKPLHIVFHNQPTDVPLDIQITLYACKPCLAELEAARNEMKA